ncbi:MAG: hypothetical protein JXA99_16080 [Candidatus Lokiarchaeota archaeon]|nr:hypothetical protein [Candidatus Lokiarchaeota archaeon]
MVNIKTIFSQCPVCKKTMQIDIDLDIISNSNKHLNPFVSEHCGETILVHIDSDGKVRGTQIVHNSLKINNDNNFLENSQFNSSAPNDIKQCIQDQSLIYLSNIEYKDMLKEDIPDIIDKILLKIISKEKEISLALLIEKSAVFGQALNKNINKKSIINILDKYIEKGLIDKQLLKNDEDLSTVGISNLKQGEHI